MIGSTSTLMAGQNSRSCLAVLSNPVGLHIEFASALGRCHLLCAPSKAIAEAVRHSAQALHLRCAAQKLKF